MSETAKIPAREEINPALTWAIEDLIPSDEAFQIELEKLTEYGGSLASFQGALKNSATTLLSFFKLYDEASLQLDKVYGYAERKSDEDTRNSHYQGFASQAASALVALESSVSFLEPEILELPEEALESFYQQEPELSTYKRAITEIRRKKDHILSQKEETLLAMAGEIARTPDTVYSYFNNADLTFPSICGKDGMKYEVTHGSFIPLMENPDRAVRKSAFESLYHTYQGMKNTAAGLLDAQVKQLRFFAKARRYSTALEASLDQTNVPVSVYHNLIQTVHENMDYMHRYVSLRKKLLKTEELHMYDLYAPIVPEANVKVPFETAKENVRKAVAPLGKAYSAILTEGFDHRWIDVYENTGKRSGAYSAGHKVHPFVLLNYKDTLDSEFTLAHEMGHAIHSYLSNQRQPAIDADYVIFVAEVASTCNEALLMQYLLKEQHDPQIRAYLINHFLEQFRTTLYRQTMFAEFERSIHEMADRGESLTADTLCELYYKLNKEYYGPDIVVDEEIAIEWARIPHFYYNYYVFQYATGFSAAIALSQRILTQGEPAVKDYLEFLSGGCSKDPITLLKGAGVDMTSPEPVRQALKLFGELINEMEAILVS